MPGIEPGAFHMQSERSTTELHPHFLHIVKLTLFKILMIKKFRDLIRLLCMPLFTIVFTVVSTVLTFSNDFEIDLYKFSYLALILTFRMVLKIYIII